MRITTKDRYFALEGDLDTCTVRENFYVMEATISPVNSLKPVGISIENF